MIYSISKSQNDPDSLYKPSNLFYDSLLRSHSDILTKYEEILNKERPITIIGGSADRLDKNFEHLFSIIVIIISLLGLILTYRKYKKNRIWQEYKIAILIVFLIIVLSMISVNLITGLLTAIFGFGQIFAITFAALVALYGIGTWRKEIKGKREFDIAFELLSSIYEFRDVISRIRHPFYAAGEGRSRERFEGESERESEVYDQAYVVFERYHSNIKVFSDLQALKYKCSALFKLDDLSFFDNIIKVRKKIFLAANSLRDSRLDAKKKQKLRTKIDKEKKQKKLDRDQAIIWEGSGAKKDTIKNDVEEIVGKAEEICIEIIRGK
jgi:hypothetical protein